MSVGISVGASVGARLASSRRRERLRNGVEVHEQAERCARERNEAVPLVVGRGLLVLGIDDEHDRAHRFRVLQHLTHRIQHQVLPDPLPSAGEIDREAPEESRGDIRVARQPLDHARR
jgi:hypothetical protein